jgi:hypothetical protein
VISQDLGKIYYPAGMGRIGIMDVSDQLETGPEFSFAQDRASNLQNLTISQTYNFQLVLDLKR